ncbi:MAG TPA: hypothetical protein VGB55_13665, partial [Tepidisphaeraceae bacterium]
VGLLGDGGAVIKDDLRLNVRRPVIWHLHTPAQVEMAGEKIVLTQNGRRVELLIDASTETSVRFRPHSTKPPQLPIKGMTHVQIILPPVREATIRVEFRPVEADR